jgi:adenosylcobinamide-GDP ribazoletransferase
MSKTDAIKAFRDLLAFLTIIPVGTGGDFVATSAEFMFLFPLIGGLIGLFAAAYFQGASFLISGLLGFVNSILQVPVELLLRFALAVMTLAFLLVLTGLQHFDGLVDLGNAIGLRRLEQRREAAHLWTVTYRGALLALSVEFLAFLGLFFLNPGIAFQAIIAAEVSAKLAMVTIVWVGHSTGKGLGARFLEKAKTKRNIIAYVISFLIVIPILGWTGLLVIAVSVLTGVLMERVAKSVFGGVSGDMIGATNESARAVTLVLLAGAFLL